MIRGCHAGDAHGGFDPVAYGGELCTASLLAENSIFDRCMSGARCHRYGVAGNVDGGGVRIVFDRRVDVTVAVFATSRARVSWIRSWIDCSRKCESAKRAISRI